MQIAQSETERLCTLGNLLDPGLRHGIALNNVSRAGGRM